MTENHGFRVNPYIAQLRNTQNVNAVIPNMNIPITRNPPPRRTVIPRPGNMYINPWIIMRSRIDSDVEESETESDLEIDLENIIIRKNVKNSDRKTFTEKDYENIKKLYDEESAGAECLICYEETKNTVLVFCCKKFFCGKCLAKWIYTNDTCPHCRVEGIVIHSSDFKGEIKENLIDMLSDDDYI